MAADGVVQIPPDSSGKKIDTSELTRSDGTVLERQRVSLGDPTNIASLAGVNPGGELLVHMKLDRLWIQLKRIAMLLEIMTGQEISENDVSRKQE